MRPNLLCRLPSLRQRRWTSTSAGPPPSSPLRILFCGADEFSAASLAALHAEHKRNPGLIESIDVVVRPPKPTGRGYKTLRPVPLQAEAESLALPVHRRDTFTGWTPPSRPNLVVAVSFGLFVPPRILRAAAYGGLNVHPSLLPDLAGPAPLHWALLAARRHTGVTLQTLSELDFDQGVVLARTPPPGIAIPDGSTVAQLRDMLAPIGAEMLVDGLRRGLHVPPWRPAEAGAAADGAAESPLHSVKLTPLHRELFWHVWARKQWEGVGAARRIELLGGRAWSHAVRPATGEVGRLGFHGVEAVGRHEWAPEVARHVDFVRARAGQKGRTRFYQTAGALARDYPRPGTGEQQQQRVVMWATPELAEVLAQIKPDEAGERTWKGGVGEVVDDKKLRYGMLVLPYFPDPDPANRGAVIIPVRATHDDVVRVRSITVPGETARPADAVLRHYSLGLDEMLDMAGQDHPRVGVLLKAKLARHGQSGGAVGEDGKSGSAVRKASTGPRGWDGNVRFMKSSSS